MYDIAFQADASENHWGCDHMALAESSDGTPGAMHGCPSLESSDRAFRFVKEHNSNPLRINGTTQVSVDILLHTLPLEIILIQFKCMNKHRSLNSNMYPHPNVITRHELIVFK